MTLPPTRKAPLNLTSFLAGICALALYWTTADPSVSYWDCPEYVVCASRLEIGHPPGNPVWMLAMRAVTMWFPLEMHARAINLASGLMMALAVFLLCRVTYRLLIFTAVTVVRKTNRQIKSQTVRLLAAISAWGGSTCFAFCDSAWFSAVEAEVYAMSAFLTALALWVMCRWAQSPSAPAQTRWLILLAYLMGLSLGVHQLTLLVLPALALVFVFSRHPQPRQTLRAWVALAGSVLLIGAILTLFMHGSLSLAAGVELFTANTLGWPLHTGAILFAVLVLALLAGGAALASRLGARRTSTALWMAAMLFFGYSAYGMILIRGAAAPPMNEAAPTDIFALQRYVARTQYGSKPLLRGATPYSRPMYEESADSSGRPLYNRYVLRDKGPHFTASLPGARLSHRSRLMTRADSQLNARAMQRAGGSYVVADHDFARVTTPELDMWLPRITSSEPAMLAAYSDWAGMDTATMTLVQVSDTFDPEGRPAGLPGPDGVRHTRLSRRPTQGQNLRMFALYQAGYMYFRYLLWNFLGRQNDIPATGETDHGNFLTGIPAADNAMLGPQHLMPAYASARNPGRNVYWGLPFLLALAGVLWLAAQGRRGRRALAVTSVLFLMTGLAITVYLNQTPGEPRERDYSFLGSFMAWAMWIACGMFALSLAVARMRRQWIAAAATAAVALGTPALMATVNFDDHNRAGRNETLDLALDVLHSSPPGILFTQGDNYTFPLWHAVETGAAPRDWQVIDVSYLATPEYAVNLMKQGHGRMPFIATPADVAFGRYAFTHAGPRTAQDTALLADALRELYAQDSPSPVFPHRWVWLTPADTTALDITSAAPSGLLAFKQLMLLDILAANNERSKPLTLHFLLSLQPSFHSALSPWLGRTAFSEIYAGSGTDSVEDALLRAQASFLMAKGSGPVQLPAYLDPVAEAHRRRNRQAHSELAAILAQKGDTATAAALMETAARRHPFHAVKPGFVKTGGKLHDEGLEHAELLLELAGATSDTTLRGDALSLLRTMRATASQWKQYYAALPPSRRNAVSADTRRLILALPRIDSLLVELSHQNITK